MNKHVGSKFGRPPFTVRVSVIFVGVVLANSLFAVAQLPTNNDPTNQIRFDTPAEADAKRSQLVNYIWSGGLPSTVPSVTTNVGLPTQSLGIDPSNVASVDRLTTNVSGWSFNALSYLMHPTNTANANRLAIVHQGHANNLEAGVGTTANHLLQQGFTVLTMMMPLHGWNTDTTAVIPGQGGVTYSTHDQMILNTSPANGGRGFRLFLEPVVQGINYLQATNPSLQNVSMVGLSGGGWTTSLMAAVDPRISLSIPVAGSAPLYVRNDDVTQSSYGDTEQTYSPLYNEDIEPDGTGGGVATWMEIYALGGYGPGRRQIKVTNEFDNCCFPGTYPNSYKTIVADKVASLGAGQWEHYLDSTHFVHQISGHVIADILSPAFGIDGPQTPQPVRLPIVDNFDDQSSGVPNGWSIDPASSGGTTAAEVSGGARIQGTGLASIVYNAPFNSQLEQPITVSAELSSISSDNFMGVFLTDNINSRAFHLGALFNMSAKQIAINADNGNGFDPAQDRITLGTLPGYTGGAATLSFSFDEDGFSVEFDAGTAGSFSSGMRPWSQIPGGFDPAKLGDQTQLFIQGYDINGGTAASVVVNSISVTGTSLGDFNGDGVVDMADYIVWRDKLGNGYTQEDYNIWRANFGKVLSVESGSSTASHAVPEPTAMMLLVACCSFALLIRPLTGNSPLSKTIMPPASFLTLHFPLRST
ncbi:MAG: hypothetical protein WD468_05230 [Pirellulales bacterium]